MDSSRNDTDIAAALRALRPAPSPEFSAGLDARVAAGFPRTGRAAGAGTRLLARLGAVSPRRILLPAGGLALTAIVVATAVVAVSEDGGVSRRQISSDSVTHSAGREATMGSGHVQLSVPAPSKAAAGAASSTESSPAESTSGVQFSTTAPSASGPYASHVHGRDIERSAQIVLGAEPAEVRDDAAQVFDAVHAADGIVLSSSIRDGAAGQAGARFELLIPAAKLGDAMASFSSIADVVSRHESTDDITAPTVGVTERLEDSDARVHSFLDQLAAAESDPERAAVEAELRAERRHQAALRSRLSTLHRRANLSHVSLRIETGAHSADGSSGAWGIGDGFDDAGRILAIAAGVVVIGLAILAPFALIALLTWLAHRAWLHRARRRALARV